MSEPWYTSENSIPKIVKDLRNSFNDGTTLPVSARKKTLRALYRMITENRPAIYDACKADLGKSRHETLLTELGMVDNDIAEMLDNIDAWAAPEYVACDLVHKMAKPQIRSDPLGLVLIIGAWNYPVQLTLVPLLGAIAAGNTVILKPSEVSPQTAQLLAKLITKYCDSKVIQVVNGGVAETTALLKERFDHILYTGNSMVGKIVMKAAAEHMTPVTLELGGKSPCIVDKEVDVKVAARRITWGRFLNCGQTCIAPDYVLCHPSQRDALVAEIRKTLEEFYGKDPRKSESYGRIVNKRHWNRIHSMMTEKGAGKVVIGGEADEADKYIAPSVMVNVNADSKVMKEEIFGPVLPIVDCKSIDEAITFINGRDKPLALYVFSSNNAHVEQVLNNTTSGGAIANDTLMHAAVPTLPFGGVGNSGCGGYHGKHSFDTFSHKKSVLVNNLGAEFVNKLRYPPYSDSKTGWIKRILMKEPGQGAIGKYLKYAAVAAVAASVGYLVNYQ